MNKLIDQQIMRMVSSTITTVEILYRLPDAPRILQTFTHQFLDTAPTYPRVRKFLQFWERTIDGPIVEVRIGNAALLRPSDLRHAKAEFLIN